MNSGWNIHLGDRVKTEATVKSPLNESFVQYIMKGLITPVSCLERTYQDFRSTYSNLGDGEIESMAIAYDCPTKVVNPYLILSDDGTARNRAMGLGISFFGIVSFFILANKQRVLMKEKAIKYVEILQKNSFSLKDSVYEKFIAELK
jgi:predicted nucleic acid-binding protein